MSWKKLKNSLLTLFSFSKKESKDSLEESTHKHLVFTAPSGAGKTTIVRHLLKHYNELDFSVSATTRDKRSHEQEGKDYYFLSKEEFESKLKQNQFIEYEEVYKGQYYGTLLSEVERIEKSGKHIVFDIDVKGAVSIKKAFGDRVLTVFIKPPSFTTLKQRLIDRNTESEEALKTRIARMKEELTYESKFDKVLVNDLLEVAFEEAEHIVETFLDLEH